MLSEPGDGFHTVGSSHALPFWYSPGMRNQPFHDDLASRPVAEPAPGLRTRGLFLLFAIGLAAVLGRVVWVQNSLQAGYLTALERTTVTYEEIPARNGRIVGEYGQVYAQDVDEFTIQVHYRWLQDPLDDGWLRREIRRRLTSEERREDRLVEECLAEIRAEQAMLWLQLSELTGLSQANLQERRQWIQDRVETISRSVNDRHFVSPTRETLHEDGLLVRLASGIRSALTTEPQRSAGEKIIVQEEESWHDLVVDCGYDSQAVIQEQPLRFPGVRIRSAYQRRYPLGTVAPHLVGARTKLRDDETLPGNDTGGKTSTGRKTLIGRAGVEKTWDAVIRSRPGRRRIVRNRRLEIIESTVVRQEMAGNDVVLTLDHDLQRFAENVLADALGENLPGYLAAVPAEQQDRPRPFAGCILVMECNTGRIVVGASGPGYSLDLFVHGTQDEWDAVINDGNDPFVNRLLSRLTPGALITPLTAIAAMEAGKLDPDEPFACDGYLSDPSVDPCTLPDGHGNVRLREALAQSCNVYFQAAALKVGVKRNAAAWARFGFGRRTGIDLPFESPGLKPPVSSSVIQLKSHVVGEKISVTPLQLARMMGAIGNGGVLVTPHVCDQQAVARQDGEEREIPIELKRQRIVDFDSAFLEPVREGLRFAVTSPTGSAHRWLNFEQVEVAAIATSVTSSTRPNQVPDALVAGYFPARDPKYVFVVSLEHGGDGSRHAAPVAAQIIQRMVSSQE